MVNRSLKKSVKAPVAALAYLCCLLNTVAAEGREAPWVGTTLDGAPCQEHFAGNRGPYDYVTERGGTLGLVERHHFTSKVEQLIAGETTVSPIPDIKFVLVTFPNHHRALYSAVRFGLTTDNRKLKRQYPAECFLQRAINFSPKDPVPRMLFGLYFHELGHPEEALKQYYRAEELTPQDANLLYNIGLAQIDHGDIPSAKEYADRAYALGISLPGLRTKLEALGAYKDQ